MYISIAQIPIPAHGLKLYLADIEIIELIPKETSFCYVKRVKYNNEVYALKLIYKDRIYYDEQEVEYLRLYKEITVLYQLDHPNIIKLFWHYEDAHCIYLLEEFGGLRLNLWIRNLKKNEVNLAPYIRQIALGLQTIHEAGFIHRDIMTKNILILNDKMVKIIDFGYTNTGISRKTKLGSFPYMAPEVTGESTYNHKADIWSFGFVIFEMYHKDYPFCSGRPGKFNEQTFIYNRDNMILYIGPQVPPGAADLIRKLLVIDPQNRPDAYYILSHPFLIREEREDVFQAFERRLGTQKILNKNDLNRRVQKIDYEDPDSHWTIANAEKQLRRSILSDLECMKRQGELLIQLIKVYKATIEKTLTNMD